MGFNFGQIADILAQVMDTDYVDIYRILPNMPGKTLMYSNVPCHIAFQFADNPDPTSVDITPIITSLRVHMATWVDIQNSDYLIAKRMGEAGEVLIAYRGLCGFPVVSQGRQSVSLLMNAAAAPDEPIIPPPPAKPSKILISFVDGDGHTIKASMEKTVPQEQVVTIEPTDISGYNAAYAYLDGILQADVAVVIDKPKAQGHNVQFIYEMELMPLYFRNLVLGLFTKDNGQMEYGFHLFTRVPVEVVGQMGSGYIFRTATNKLDHPEMGAITLMPGSVLKIYTLGVWAIIVSSVEQQPDSTYVFEVEWYSPTIEEEAAYETSWYDV